jgi:YVTN family beta-propeller protein
MSKLMKCVLLSIIGAAGSGLCQDVSAETAKTPLLYVDNSTGDNISVINVAQNKVIATIPVGTLPHAICASGDGRKVYTTTEADYALKQIDTATNTVVNSWPLPADPNECTVTKDGRYVVVALRGNNTAAIFDTTTNQFVKTLPIKGPHNCFTPMNGSNDYVYCEEQRGFDIAKVDMKTMEIVQKTKVNGEARPFIVTPDLNTMYVALSDLSGVAIVDVPAQTIAEVVLPPTKLMPCTIEPGNTPTHGIGLGPDMKKLWITDVADAGVYTYDLTTKKMSQKISVGKCPNWFAISSDGKWVAVTNAESNSVSIIDAKTEKVLSEIPVGKGPKRIEFVDVPASSM